MKKCMLLLLAVLSVFHLKAQQSAKYFKGYSNHVKGELMPYNSPQPDANKAMIARNYEGNNEITWEAEALPLDYKEDMATFIVIAGVDVNRAQYDYYLKVNGKKYFTMKAPEESILQDINATGPQGSSLEFKGTMIDQYSDLFGYMFITLPVSELPKGEKIKFSIEAEDAQSNSWFMVFKYGVEGDVEISQEPAVMADVDGSGESQMLRIRVLHYDQDLPIVVQTGKEKTPFTLKLGANIIRVPVPKAKEAYSLPLLISSKDQDLHKGEFEVQPVRPYTVYLMHHSHVDVGYTHTQEEVKHIQWENLEDALDLIEKTKDYPEGSKFIWNTEVTWALESYIKEKPQEDIDRLMNAIQEGSIEVGGLYANQLTSLARGGEMLRFTQTAREITDITDVPIESAMITDVPGYSWSMVNTLAQSGIKYFSMGTNVFHRIGSSIVKHGDRPFYWESASGEERVLCWLHEKGYSYFHTGLGFKELKVSLTESTVFDYILELEKRPYPYDIVTLRYNIGSDNGPVDPTLSDAIANWNEKYSSPKIVMSTMTEAFEQFEQKYGEELPVYKGDFTPYWEDGAASSSRETTLVRHVSDSLYQAAVLFHDQANLYTDNFTESWLHVMRYNEHTWGAYNSITEPDHQFVADQWSVKQGYALTAQNELHKIWNENSSNSNEDKVKLLKFYNTLAWGRKGHAVLPASMNLAGDKVIGEDGNTLTTQRLSNGDLLISLPELDGFSEYSVKFKKSKTKLTRGSKENVLENQHLKVEIDAKTGNISSIFDKVNEKELISIENQANKYTYVNGREPKKNQQFSSFESLMITENGPVLKEITATLESPGQDSHKVQYRLYNDSRNIEIIHVMDKEDVLSPEGVHVQFPFDVENYSVRIEQPFGEYEVDKEQIPASNKNYFTAENYADISNDEHGVTLFMPDNPLLEIGEITSDPIAYGWLENSVDKPVLIPYLMNNYWETNYRASQSGVHQFRFIVESHGEFDPVVAKKRAKEIAHPIVSMPASFEWKAFPLKVNNNSITLEAIHQIGDINVYSIYNASSEDVELNLESLEGEIYYSNLSGEKLSKYSNDDQIVGKGLKHVVIVK
ncbi:glycoside hydrolase family 38 N-terminal domain-containing protein [Aureibacter tunicatorum]|uniref:Glycosyl hydrolase family 38 n=1 Tax=Aureibacter tunicatorum TaxID=866807 RepID=A0AAE3XMH1_9BACT|nr:glycoside hydrolase family 38 C-terminal domain-containing protein [Aureibacter tunicatorum]MDR6238635.1 hypothetical protein [Aureibacter tunicatorum]BDD05434.1 hypothetical protein AUTU_29170 [Aureibacter tunicatorum]